MIEETVSPQAAQKFYDTLGAGHDRAEIYEAKAKQQGLALLNPQPGQRLLNVGVGTGKEHALLKDAIAPGGLAFGLDLSPVMLHLTYSRTGTPLCRANVAALPYLSATFDCLFSSYLLDLLPTTRIRQLLADFYRVLKPGGRLALVSLTEGVDLPSRALVSLWKTAYAVSPIACGGCRPLQLTSMVEAAGFIDVQREVVVQLAVPSEVVVAGKPL